MENTKEKIKRLQGEQRDLRGERSVSVGLLKRQQRALRENLLGIKPIPTTRQQKREELQHRQRILKDLKKRRAEEKRIQRKTLLDLGFIRRVKKIKSKKKG